MGPIYIIALGIFAFLMIMIGIVLYRSFFMPVHMDHIAKMIESGQAKAAVSALNAILAKEPGNHHARYYLALAYKTAGQLDRALVEMRHVAKYIGVLKEIKEIDFRTQLAALYDQLKIYDEAFKEYLLLSQMDSKNFFFLFKLGDMYMKKGTYDRALKTFQMSYKLNPNYEETIFNIGYLLINANAHRDAKPFLDKAVKLAPANARYWYYLGMACQKMDQLEAAINAFDKAQNDEEYAVRAYLQKGTAYVAIGSIEQAIVEMQAGAKHIKRESDPSALNLRYMLAQSLEKNRDLPSAIEQWEKINQAESAFRDVPQKLSLYKELRYDDNLKDFMIISDNKFQKYCTNLVTSMNYNVMEIFAKDKVVNISAIIKTEKGEAAGNLRNTVLFKITRDTRPIQESVIREFAEEVKSRRVTKGIFITSGEFTKESVAFADTRPIDLYDQRGLTRLLKNI